MSKYSFSEKQFKFEDSSDPNKTHLVLLSLDDAETIYAHKWYERAYTAEYVIENEKYGSQFDYDEDIAYKIACDVRDIMDKHLITENAAIEHVFSNFDINKYR